MRGPELRGERLLLRPLEAADVGDAYVAWLADPRVNAFLETRHAPQPLEAIRAFVQACNESGDSWLYGMFIDRGGRHIGNIKLGPWAQAYHRAEVGLLIGDPEQWGKGYGAEAISLITRFAFETLNLKKVTAGCYAANEGSRRAFLAKGWTEIGRRRDHWLTEGGWMDDVMLERLNPDWHA
jgi:[ribosomal protein S5]-alanine N-acetyltransferase